MKTLMKSKFLSLKGPVLVGMLMATVASSSLTAQPPKFDGDEEGASTTTSSSSTSSSSSSTSSSATASSSRSTVATSSVPVVTPKNDVEIHQLKEGLKFVHIPKTAGTNLTTAILDPYFKAKEQPYIYLGHKTLRMLPKYLLRDGVPVATWLRDPLKRTVSMLQFTKPSGPLLRRPDPKHNTSNCFFYVTESGNKFFEQVDTANLNNVDDLHNLALKMRGEYDSFRPGNEFCWPFFAYTEYFSPPGMDYTIMDDDKVDLCVRFALENVDFFGDVENFEESLNELNIAFDFNINPMLARKKVNEGLQSNQTIDLSRPEIKDLFDKLLVWEYKIYNKIRAAHRWRVCVPIMVQPGIVCSHKMQFRLPIGFCPDLYLSIHSDLDKVASKILGSDIRKKRKWALTHYVFQGRDEGRHYSGTYQFVDASFPVGFDPDAYIALNPELGIAARLDCGADIWKIRKWVASHYLTHGAKEGRCYLKDQVVSSVPSLFNADFYLSKAPFLQKSTADMSPAERRNSAWMHYCNTGINEGRQFSNNFPPFNPDVYLSLHSDLQIAFGGIEDLNERRKAAIAHFLSDGMRENRQVSLFPN